MLSNYFFYFVMNYLVPWYPQHRLCYIHVVLPTLGPVVPTSGKLSSKFTLQVIVIPFYGKIYPTGKKLLPRI